MTGNGPLATVPEARRLTKRDKTTGAGFPVSSGVAEGTERAKP